MPEEEFKRYGDRLTELAEWLRAEGCPMAFHHHMGTVVETEREVDLLMARTGDAVGLLFDTGHLHFAGGDVPATARRHGRRINHVHCKDIRAEVLARLKAENWSFLQGVIEGVFTVPGDGAIDFGAVAEVLAEIGYSGWVVVEAEQDPEKANPLEMARIGHKALTEAFARRASRSPRTRAPASSRARNPTACTAPGSRSAASSRRRRRGLRSRTAPMRWAWSGPCRAGRGRSTTR